MTTTTTDSRTLRADGSECPHFYNGLVCLQHCKNSVALLIKRVRPSGDLHGAARSVIPEGFCRGSVVL